MRRVWDALFTRDGRAAWAAGLILAAWHGARVVANARTEGPSRYDEGIELSAGWLMSLGELAHVDHYQPYGMGLGLPGALMHLIGADSVLAHRLAYSWVAPAATLLATVLVARRAGLLPALAVGLMTLPSNVIRYAGSFAAILGFVLLMDAGARKTAARTLTELVEARPRLVLGASAVLSLAAWIRTEYALLPVLWAGVLLLCVRRGTPERRELAVSSAVLGLLPTILIVANGSLRPFLEYLEYSAFHTREFRNQEIDLGRFGDWTRSLTADGPVDAESAAIVSSYGAGVLAVLFGLVLFARSRPQRPMEIPLTRLLTIFFVAICGFVFLSQFQRFSSTYGVAGNPIFWTALALVAASTRARLVVAVAGLIFAYQILDPYRPTTIRNTFDMKVDTGHREAVFGFNRLPVGDNDWPSLASLPVVWRDQVADRSHVFSASRRNDVGLSNDAIVPWLVRARHAGWSMTFDPGLVDRKLMQERAVDDLCEQRAAVVQLENDYPTLSGAPRRELPHGPRLLDQWLAVNWRLEAKAGFYRVLVPRFEECRDPARLSPAARIARRDELIALDDLPAAGALGVLGLEQAAAAERAPSDDDLAAAVLGGYAVDPELLAGPRLASLRSLYLEREDPQVPRLLAAGEGSWVMRMADAVAWARRRVATDRGTAAKAIATIRRTTRERPVPEAIRSLLSFVPIDPRLAGELAAAGADQGPARLALLRAQLDKAFVDGTVDEAYTLGQSLGEALAREDPVAAGAAYNVAAARLEKLGALNCAVAFKIAADKLPGVKVLGIPPTPPPCP